MTLAYLSMPTAPPWVHMVFEAAAYAIGYRVYARGRARQGDGIDDESRLTVILAAAVGALIGSKVLHHASHPALLKGRGLDPAFWMGGKTIVGALIGGWLAVEWVKRRIGVTRATGDLFVLPLIVAMAVGRIGCLVTGLADDTVGVPSALPWAIDFGDGARHPTAAYEIVFLVGLGWLLRRPVPGWPEGRRFRAFLLGYLAFRLAVDFLKPYEILGGLRGIQWACAVVLGYHGLRALRPKPQGESIG
ncbi:MAG: prolipoprotein diacylglyceryl transferase [Planctomycetota bacterium]